MERQDPVQERIDGLTVGQGATMSRMGLRLTNLDISTKSIKVSPDVILTT